ncbi:type II 3-dehydroquinate dehydratase [Williamsia sp.]|uniref:type II 3-dehydroquinate dehydratase n=1 Tax=Williamsia sp. TaxID=1872085 RepID=UPI002F954368
MSEKVGAMTEKLPVLLLNGPNLNTLGTRQPEIYGSDSLDDVVALATATAAEYGFAVDARQTNHEGEMLEWIQQSRGQISGIVINPAAWTHTSIALRDALVIPEVPVIEVHISNVHAREEFRHTSYVSPIASGVIAGLGIRGYEFAIRRIVDLVGEGSGSAA